MGLCKYCKNWTDRCGIEPAHCMCRTAESRMSCTADNSFAPFTPVEGLKFGRDYVLDHWKKHIKKG